MLTNDQTEVATTNHLVDPQAQSVTELGIGKRFKTNSVRLKDFMVELSSNVTVHITTSKHNNLFLIVKDFYSCISSNTWWVSPTWIYQRLFWLIKRPNKNYKTPSYHVHSIPPSSSRHKTPPCCDRVGMSWNIIKSAS